MTRSGINSWLAFPVMSKGKRIGGLALASMGPRVWRVEEASLGEVVASQLGAGLDRIQTAEQTHHQERLAAIGQPGGGSADFNNILKPSSSRRAPDEGTRSSAAGVQRTRTILSRTVRRHLGLPGAGLRRRSLLHMQPWTC
jgi:hypothetical protein